MTPYSGEIGKQREMVMGWMLGTYVKRLLDERDWSANKLSRKLGSSHSYVSAILHGGTAKDKNPPRISVDTLLALAQALNVPEAHLLLAYKGIDPDAASEKAERFDLEREVMLSALRAGREWSHLDNHDRQQLMTSVCKLTRRFVDITVEHELGRLG